MFVGADIALHCFFLTTLLCQKSSSPRPLWYLIDCRMTMCTPSCRHYFACGGKQVDQSLSLSLQKVCPTKKPFANATATPPPPSISSLPLFAMPFFRPVTMRRPPSLSTIKATTPVVALDASWAAETAPPPTGEGVSLLE